ncbi:hypothetical protein K8Q98_01320 [Candidatus Nomurabacteria bacterium]|nr:hypothetical protein [Candidatus Nomurabacteria bacterium]
MGGVKNSIIILIATGVLVVASSWLSRKDDVVVVPEVKAIVECPSDLESFTNTINKVKLIENKQSNGFNGVLKGYKVSIKRTQLTSEIACGYLHYIASFDNKPLEQNSMTLFMTPGYGQFGGHIWADEQRGAIINETSTSTEFIIPLDTITHDGTAKTPIKITNWAKLFNVSDTFNFGIALSADTPLGNLNLVEIVYKCINKETGKETDNCKLEVTNVSGLTTSF